MIPTYFVYMLLFFWVINLKTSIDFRMEVQALEEGGVEGKRNTTNSETNLEDEETAINQSLSMEGIRESIKYVGWPMLNLSLVYYLEYMCTTSFVDIGNSKKDTENSDSWMVRESFVLLQFAYQTGVFISRSSLDLIKIERVWILTGLQFINFLIFGVASSFKLFSVEVQLVLMVWVGLMGGSSYVNCMYLILENKHLQKKHKEVTINIASLFNDIGILAASLCAQGILLTFPQAGQ